MKIFFFFIINFISAIILNNIAHYGSRKKINIFTCIIIYFLILFPVLWLDDYIIISTICFLMTMIGYYLQVISFSSENKLNAFNLGLLSSMCSLFNIIYIVLFPLIVIWISFLQKMSFRLLIILLAGFLIPFLVLKFDIFSFNISLESMNLNIVSTTNKSTNFSYYHIFMYLLIFASAYEIIKHFKKKKNYHKYMYFIFLFIPICCNVSNTLFSSINFIIPLVHIKTLVIVNYIIYSKHYQFGTFLVGLWLLTLLIETIRI
tara:strand:+ start:817 stop:1599 length:783 start_codon:yes stop_codon:yes gene_type:complete